eukprot:scaffold206199_cov16-Prasinocladus_malaysianus.AAC.2
MKSPFEHCDNEWLIVAHHHSSKAMPTMGPFIIWFHSAFALLNVCFSAGPVTTSLRLCLCLIDAKKEKHRTWIAYYSGRHLPVASVLCYSA